MISLLSSEATPRASAPNRDGISAPQAFRLLLGLRLQRWRNLALHFGPLAARAPAGAPAQRRSSTRAGSGAGRLLLAAWLPIFLCWQSFRLFQSTAHDHGVAALLGRSALLCTLNVLSLLLMTLLGARSWDTRGDADSEWLSTLPAPVWALRAAKLVEAAVFTPFVWLQLFPFFAGLGIAGGLGPFAPLLALAISFSLSLGSVLAGAVGEATGFALSRSPALRFLRFVAPMLALFVFVGTLACMALSKLGVDTLGDWLSFSQDLPWLPFSEPARALLALRAAPARGLAWLSLFAVEMAAWIGLGTLTLRKLYRADFGAGLELRSVRARGVTGSAAGRSLGGWCGAVIGKDLIWLRSNPTRLAGSTLQVVLFNALAIAAVRLVPGLHTLQLPAVALLAVGTLLTVILLEGLLEAERAALGHWATLPRSISWVLSRKVLLAVALGLAGALPAASYAASTVANFGSSVPALAYAAACVGLLGFFHAAFWMRGVDAAAPVSVLQGMLRLAQTLIVASILYAGLRDPSRPVTTAATFILAVAFACALWHGLPQRAALALDRSAAQTPALTASYALATLLVLQFVRGFVLGVATSSGASLPKATTIAWLTSGWMVLSSSLLWLWMRGSPALSERLGLCAGKGRRVILREGLLWSLPAILFNQAYWAVAGAHATQSLQPASAPPATMTVLATSPIAALVVGVMAGPIVEELVFRGMLYRSLRTRWAVLPCWLLTTAVFLTDHTPAAAIPVLFGSVCITLAFERSRSLYAAVLVHALYNGVLVLQLVRR